MTGKSKLTRPPPLDIDEDPAATLTNSAQPRQAGKGIEYIPPSLESAADNESRKDGVGVVDHLRRAFSLHKYRGPSRKPGGGGMKRNQSDTRFHTKVSEGGGLNATKKLWSYPTFSMRDKRRKEISFEMILKEEIPAPQPHPSPSSSKGFHRPLPRLGCHSKSPTALERDADPTWPPLLPKPPAPAHPPKSTITSAQLASFRKVSAPILRKRPLPQPPAPFTDTGHSSFYHTQDGSIRHAPATIRLVTRPSAPPSPVPKPFGPSANFTTSTPLARRVHSASDVIGGKVTRRPTASLMPRKPVPRFLDVPFEGDDGHISGVTAFTRSPPASTPKPTRTATEFRSPHLPTPPTPKYDVYVDPFAPTPSRRPPDTYDDSYEHYQNTLFADVLNTWGLPLDLLAQSVSRSRRESLIEASKSSHGSRPSRSSRPTDLQIYSKPSIMSFPAVPTHPRLQNHKPSPLGERRILENQVTFQSEPRRKHGTVKKFVSMDERRLRQPVGRVKDIVDIIEDRQGDRTITPVRELGWILHRPSSVSSDNLHSESKRLMNEARSKARPPRWI
ncbi:hypothetical protein L198_07506 [Cryptococcus wingfieldii CBS 7118]|uniref:Uncharacterized protein n=1 Tax=Cryptococcus wingfieldii CBS 7118 TaxID=1295528 RepID=A0A1E3IAT3_9TREE|nr:hypothetical protein L198_07506 [Cryptococcus wingfieldii CBS 7118]ODN85677.1 hypothetical protein L198_07506 [Cryptococcus wingfieldii CBS 7118]